jgi:hypothetical protein
MTALIVLLLVVALYSWVYVLGRELMRLPRNRRLDELVRREENRNRFGRLRTRLFQQAALGEISTATPRFAMASAFMTHLMRRPEDYPAVARQTMAYLPDENAGERLRKEAPISATEAHFFTDAAHALDQLCRDYNVVYRTLARVADAANMPPLWLKMHTRMERPSLVPERLRAVFRVERTFREFGRAHADDDCAAAA